MWSVNGPEMGHATIIPIKLLKRNRPISGGVKKYGGGEKSWAARVEIATILDGLVVACYRQRDLPAENYSEHD